MAEKTIVSNRFDGKTVVITGGASGIGLATGRRLAAEGAKVVIGDLDEVKGPEVAAELGGLFVKVNVTAEEQVKNLFQQAKDTYGSVDVAFNNAGINPTDDSSILDTGLDAWSRVQNVNLTSVPVQQVRAHAHGRAEVRVDHQLGVVRGAHGGGDVADLVLGVEGRCPVDEP